MPLFLILLATNGRRPKPRLEDLVLLLLPLRPPNAVFAQEGSDADFDRFLPLRRKSEPEAYEDVSFDRPRLEPGLLVLLVVPTRVTPFPPFLLIAWGLPTIPFSILLKARFAAAFLFLLFRFNRLTSTSSGLDLDLDSDVVLIERPFSLSPLTSFLFFFFLFGRAKADSGTSGASPPNLVTKFSKKSPRVLRWPAAAMVARRRCRSDDILLLFFFYSSFNKKTIMDVPTQIGLGVGGGVLGLAALIAGGFFAFVKPAIDRAGMMSSAARQVYQPGSKSSRSRIPLRPEDDPRLRAMDPPTPRRRVPSNARSNERLAARLSNLRGRDSKASSNWSAFMSQAGRLGFDAPIEPFKASTKSKSNELSLRARMRQLGINPGSADISSLRAKKSKKSVSRDSSLKTRLRRLRGDLNDSKVEASPRDSADLLARFQALSSLNPTVSRRTSSDLLPFVPQTEFGEYPRDAGLFPQPDSDDGLELPTPDSDEAEEFLAQLDAIAARFGRPAPDSPRVRAAYRPFSGLGEFTRDMLANRMRARLDHEANNPDDLRQRGLMHRMPADLAADILDLDNDSEFGTTGEVVRLLEELYEDDAAGLYPIYVVSGGRRLTRDDPTPFNDVFDTMNRWMILPNTGIQTRAGARG